MRQKSWIFDSKTPRNIPKIKATENYAFFAPEFVEF